MRTDIRHLEGLYAITDDPWNFRTSLYEADKFAATLRALPRPRYAHALELGCGNGELARRVARRCDRYTGIDAVARPLAAARRVVPNGRFLRRHLPCPLPSGPYDLVLLSEILYFLDAADVEDLAYTVDANWPDADIVVVTWCGPTGHTLQGEDALRCFAAATRRAPEEVVGGGMKYRIDNFDPLPRASA